MNLLETLLHPDRDEFPNRTIVVTAANLLEIGEFQFLQLAFAHWHGRDMRADETREIFDSFMVRSEVPGWALLYARDICNLDRVSELDGNNPDYHRYDVIKTPVSRLSPKAGFLAAVVFLAGTLGGALALANQTANKTNPCSGQFPPCVNTDEIPGSRNK
ncbi:MAG: hypothetical protein HN478_12740 [Rhodospirillaceae bacterium]|jgi:hypothetical protein|nr:hypothetical protein [Rhodospirillaceae bacterium]MBT4490001.1 hypothetical protein [Rhodospirillaceae bacterium]MBT5191369.1 hypothetical protein [Rhodospirillaceae bacterium]MBT5898188.1 hypothetical protein [Rhodospirillaceae bacterium]MBT6426859.1 hypothetical protein [Rhodospirillaceae bacterium]